MPYIPHTEQDKQAMLAALKIPSTDALFSEIPENLRLKGELKEIPESLSEAAMLRLLEERSEQDKAGLCFIGAGAYEHNIPSVIWDIVGRGEYLTAYTPYQAEASQGTLQTIYEYQSMMANLMRLDVSNASMYDGASALAEAVLMATRAKQMKTVLIPATLNPFYRQTIKTITYPHGLNLVEVPFSMQTGRIELADLKQFEGQEIAALVLPQPNFFGVLENIDALTDWAHEQKTLLIANVNPLATALLKAPGTWGKDGADIAVGDGQPLGSPLSSGGPYFGFMCCKKDYMRQLPGRIVGRTVDTEGKTGFVLTLQAREQHIRRAKATSNICSNQALMATAATIYMSLLGPEGMQRTASLCHDNAKKLCEKLSQIQGVEKVFSAPFFHEFVLKLSKPVDVVLAKLAEAGIQGGYDLSGAYPKLGNAILICATETKTADDLNRYSETLQQILRG